MSIENEEKGLAALISEGEENADPVQHHSDTEMSSKFISEDEDHQPVTNTALIDETLQINEDEPVVIEPSDDESALNDGTLSDVAIEPEKEADNEDGVKSLPKQLIIGHYSNIKKKDLLRYLFNRAATNMNVATTAYDIRKHGDGYIWSLQDGGANLGCLSSVCSMLDNDINDIVIDLDDRQMQIIRKPSQTGFSSFLINSDERLPGTEGVEFKDKINPIVKQGMALLIFSAAIFAIGLTFFLGSAVFKYVIYDKTSQIVYEKKKIEMPHTFGNRLYVSESEYISEIRFRNGTWQEPLRKEEAKEEAVIDESAVKDESIENPELDEAKNILAESAK
jgi:hypothetical protein